MIIVHLCTCNLDMGSDLMISPATRQVAVRHYSKGYLPRLGGSVLLRKGWLLMNSGEMALKFKFYFAEL